jgi:ParB family chromosome partitioning protein
MAEKLGKSRSSITETLSLAAMPEEVRQMCRLADIQSKSLLIQVVRQSDSKKMLALLERFQKEGVSTRQDARKATQGRKKAVGRPKSFIFHYQPKEKSFKLDLKFRRSEVDREEIIRTLRAIIDELSGAE